MDSQLLVFCCSASAVPVLVATFSFHFTRTSMFANIRIRCEGLGPPLTSTREVGDVGFSTYVKKNK